MKENEIAYSLGPVVSWLIILNKGGESAGDRSEQSAPRHGAQNSAERGDNGTGDAAEGGGQTSNAEKGLPAPSTTVGLANTVAAPAAALAAADESSLISSWRAGDCDCLIGGSISIRIPGISPVPGTYLIHAQVGQFAQKKTLTNVGTVLACLSLKKTVLI